MGASIFSAVGNIGGDIAGGVGDLFASGGYQAEAQSYRQASSTILEGLPYLDKAISLEDQNAAITKASTAVQEAQTERQLYMSTSGAKANAGGNGVATSGSTGDVLRSSAEQGALAKGLVRAQGQINENAYEAQKTSFQVEETSTKAQAEAYQGQAAQADAAASAAQAGAGGSFFSGILGAAALFI